MTTSTALVGPLPVVRFHDGTVLAADPPRDTCDPRWEACTEHRTACDCREAELNEDRNEYRAMYQAVIEAARRILAGHPTHHYAEVPSDREGMTYEANGCMCSGCQIVRASYLPLNWAGLGPSPRFVAAADHAGETLWLDHHGDVAWLKEGDYVPDGYRRLYVQPATGDGAS